MATTFAFDGFGVLLLVDTNAQWFPNPQRAYFPVVGASDNMEACNVGDEGGFAPNVQDNNEVGWTVMEDGSLVGLKPTSSTFWGDVYPPFIDF